MLVLRTIRNWLLAWGLVLASSALALPALAREVPKLQARVNDAARMLSPEGQARLEQRLAEYEARTQNQFALLTIDTLDGDSIEDFSVRAVEAWKLGKKGVDNGLLLLVVLDDRKFRIEVGYGLEGVITDLVSARTLREILRPAFRNGDYAGGINQTFDHLMRVASGEAVSHSEAPVIPAPKRQRRGGSLLGLALLALFFVLPVLGPLGLFGRRRGLLDYGGGSRGRRSSWGGIGGGGGFGGFGGGGGGFGGFGGGGGGGFGGGGGGGFGGGGASGSW